MIEAMAKHIAARDLGGVTGLAAPELAADIRRLHDEDMGLFWQRGQEWVDNAGSGVSIRHRQDNTRERWRSLVDFGNGNQETVTFTRIEGMLLFEAM